MEHGFLLEQGVLVICTLKLMDLLSFHKLQLLLLDYNVSEAILHLKSVKSDLILVPGLILDRGPRTVVPLKSQAQSVPDRLTLLRQGLVRLLATGINN